MILKLFLERTVHNVPLDNRSAEDLAEQLCLLLNGGANILGLRVEGSPEPEIKKGSGRKRATTEPVQDAR